MVLEAVVTDELRAVLPVRDARPVKLVDGRDERLLVGAQLAVLRLSDQVLDGRDQVTRVDRVVADQVLE